MTESKKITTSIFAWLANHNGWIVTFIIVFTLGMEYYEHGGLKTDFFFVAEISFFFLSTVAVGLLVWLLTRAIKKQQLSMTILELKRWLAFEMMRQEDWDRMLELLASMPSRVARVTFAQLFIYEPEDGRLAVAASWRDHQAADLSLAFDLDCQVCNSPGHHLPSANAFHQFVGRASTPGMGVYCLPVQYNNDLLALIRFQVHPKETLSSDQAFILDSLGIDMALAFRVGKDRKAYDDLQVAEASLAERRHLSHLLHDNLGQNLAYLRFKLGQIVASQPVDTSQAMARDLNRLWDVAEKSYDIVRGTLETITPRMSNDLTNILMDLARSTTQQANMQLSFKSNGEPGEVTSPVRRELYYVFREVFNNIQRHASASKVDVLLNWGQHDVAVQIFDDGVGFEPGRVDTERHFGYRIIQDRLAEIHGDLNLESAAGQGTKVTICVPR